MITFDGKVESRLIANETRYFTVNSLLQVETVDAVDLVTHAQSDRCRTARRLHARHERPNLELSS